MLTTQTFALLLLIPAASDAGAKPIAFTLRNDSAVARREVVRVPIPVGRGALAGKPWSTARITNREVGAQARVVTRWLDGSARRVMLSFPISLAAGQVLTGQYGQAGPPSPGLPIMTRREQTYVVSTAAYAVEVQGDMLRLMAGERVLATVASLGPKLEGAKPATTEVIEQGPFFVWLRWRQEGANYGRELDVQVDQLGHVELTQRIIRHLHDDGWTPDFGFEVTCPQAKPAHLPKRPVHYLCLDPRSAFAKHPELVASMELADGTPLSLANPLALRQNRGTLSATADKNGALRVRSSRLEPVEKENGRLMIQEGQWRVGKLVISPCPAAALAARIDTPICAHADWRAYDAVYHTGPPLEVKRPLLKQLVERYVFVITRLCINGDDWGNMTSYQQAADKAAINSMVRYNHCKYVWEDYFRTGDPRLRKVAVDWSENYRNFSVYWGHVEKYYGGSRRGRRNRNLPGSPHGPGTYMVRYNNAVGFCTKGYLSFWLAYEETGDPRFKHAAEAQARYSAKHVHANRGEMRNVGMVADFAKLYEYTGDRFYLDQALRLWEEFKERQQPDLMFTQSGKKPTGNHLYIFDDAYGYKHPFYKPYITQYATNALPYLLQHQPNDERLRRTIIACNNWMAKVQTPGGGWGYPGPSTGGVNWGLEYCHGLMLAQAIKPNNAYLDAVQRSLRPIVALFERYGAISSGIRRWEAVVGGINTRKLYHLATDRDRMKDFTHGRVRFDTSPDNTVYFQAVLREYLRHRDEATLFERDKIVDKILRLPTYLPGHWGLRGDARLSIKLTHSITPQGLRVRLAVTPTDELATKRLMFSWRFPDGAGVEGQTAEHIFPSAGIQEVHLTARAGKERYEARRRFRAPVGPADLGWERWPKGIRIQAETIAAQGGCDKPVQIWHDRRGADGAAFSHWDKKGHWLEYATEVPSAGRYYLLAKYALPHDGRRDVLLDGKALGTLKLRDTGGYTYADRDDYGVALLRNALDDPMRIKLSAGNHRLRFVNVDGKGCNFDYVEFIPCQSRAQQ